MGLQASLKIAKRSLTRRKTKNLSAILAITLGVTLMVGIQITTDTLENAFLTSLLVGEGEVDIRVSNATGGFLTAADEDKIFVLAPDALGIMPELRSSGPIMVGSQFEPAAIMKGIPVDYPTEFGSFYDWQSGEEMNIKTYLEDNTSVLISSNLAEDLGLNKSSELPVSLTTEFNNLSLKMMVNSTTGLPIINFTTGLPIFTVEFTIERVELSIVGIYDSRIPGIGAANQGVLFSLEGLQDWLSLLDVSRKKDIISSYLITYQTDHFSSPIDEEFLQEHFDALEEALPQKTVNNKLFDVYAIDSTRLTFMGIVDFIFDMMSAFLNVLGLLIIITGVLLITNVQLMSVEDREFQTGVMRAVGEKRRGIFRSMLFETLFQGFFGGIFGLFGGLIFGQIVASYLAGLFGSGSASVQPVINENVVIFSVILGVILGIFTGLLPALRASRVNIVEALRGIKLVFEQKSGRNLVLLGILLSIIGIVFLLSNNPNINEDLDYIWQIAGWDSIAEWENILLGAGFLFSGLGIILSRFIDRTKAFNLTAIVLWATPVFLFVVAMGEGWISDMSGAALNLLIFSIVEIIIGSVLIVGMNLPLLMRVLRGSLIKISGVKGVAQVAPALISSHKTRSTLTFAIFAVVLTLNVTVASLVATNIDSSIGQSEEDSRGIDLYVTLSKPEAVLDDSSYTEELYNLDSSITDIIGLKTFSTTTDFTKFVATKDPYSSEFNPQSHLLPIGFTELRSNQIRGNAENASEDDWRYDFYLAGLPDGVRPEGMSTTGFSFSDSDMTDDELLDLSKEAWDAFFDPAYEMSAYNVSFDLELLSSSDSLDFERFFQDLDEVEVLEDVNGTVIKKPIVFTDSFILPIGMQIWVPMNTSIYGFSNYQSFVIGGRFDSQRAGGFPLSESGFGGAFGNGGSSGDSMSSSLGSIYIPERFSEFTNFFGEADGVTPTSRAFDQFDTYLIKTKYAIDDPAVETIVKDIEEFTNTENSGYRELINDSFIVATAISLYSKLESSLEMMEQMTNFLQIYVNFGLIIGAVGMAVISVRNVAERKREIGMMRAIGFPRLQVMLAALLELLVLGFIGLMIGVVNGLFINVGFANMLDVPVVIPWGTIGAYLSFITFIGLLAGAIPGWVASRIPAAEALRYVG